MISVYLSSACAPLRSDAITLLGDAIAPNPPPTPPPLLPSPGCEMHDATFLSGFNINLLAASDVGPLTSRCASRRDSRRRGFSSYLPAALPDSMRTR